MRELRDFSERVVSAKLQATQQLTFDRYSVDLPNARLWRGNQCIALTRKAFAVLRYLLDHAGQLVTKAELFDALWSDTVVSDGALTFCIVELRKALGDDAKAPRFIETVHGRGYRFLPAVSAGTVSSSKFLVSRQKGESLDPAQPETRNQKLETPLVGRETELAHLHQQLAKALNGERQIVFVTGEAGIGKTTLVEVFVAGVRRPASEEERQNSKVKGQKSKVTDPRPPAPDPWIAVGQCIEHYGLGEPYMPILEALGRLCRQPGGEQLMTLLGQYAPTWLVQMPSLLNATELAALQHKTQGATRERMLREMGEALEVITAKRPLVLWLEDLHWSDASTLELLSVLARRREPARLLVIGTYRPVEVIVQEHPLRTVKQELHLHGLCAELPLGLLSEAHVAEYLARRREPEREPERKQGRSLAGVCGVQETTGMPQLAHIIHRRTDGNPLFMVTMVDDLLSQGVLVAVDEQWAVSGELTTVETRVPDNVQQLITQQIERLSGEERRLLEVASVAGMEFSAAVVAAGTGTAAESVEECCEGLAQQGCFLRANGVADWPDGTVATRYSFLHALYQEVLYQHIPVGRRQRLHQQIGERQEAAYGEQAREIAAELAVHFEQGHDYSKAVQYLQQAGENALRRSANREALAHLSKGLALLTTVPETPERSQQELTLHVTLSAPLVITKGFSAPEVKATYDRAWELCRELGETPHHFFVLLGLSRFYIARSEFRTAAELSAQLLRLAHQAHDPTLLLLASMRESGTLLFQGEFTVARTQAEQGLTLYDPQQHGALIFLYGEDPAVTCLALAAVALWYLGYADQALDRISQALQRAQEIAHPFGLTFSLFWTAFLHQCRGEVQKTEEQTETLLTYAQALENPQHVALGTGLHGWILAEQGQTEDGITQLKQGLAGLRSIGQELGRPYFSARLAAACSQGGRVTEGMQVLAEALDFTCNTGESMHQAELYRLAGELSLQKGARGWGLGTRSSSPQAPSLKPLVPSGVEEAEGYFLKAIDIARKQQAKSLELRATVSLARLRQHQAREQEAGSTEQREGSRKKDARTTKHAARVRLAEAHRMLSDVYHWFTEGFDTKDLREAKMLLEELSH